MDLLQQNCVMIVLSIKKKCLCAKTNTKLTQINSNISSETSQVFVCFFTNHA